MDQISVLSSAVVQCPNEVERQSLTYISCLLGPWELEWKGLHGNRIFEEAGGKWPQTLEIILLQERENHIHLCVLGRQEILSEVAEGEASFGLWPLENGIGFA